MATVTQCTTCGAVLLEDDLFCGECGAPNPLAEDAVVQRPPAPPPPPPSGRPPRMPPSSPEGTGWRVAWIALIVLGVAACLLGLIAFVLMGATPSDTATVQEGWLYSALCCLLPIGGTGAGLLFLGLIIWYARVRRRDER